MSEITRTRTALLAYVTRFGIADTASQRLLAARLWRALPRGLNAAQAIAAAERKVAGWASERVGFAISPAQLRLAVLETGADARSLLADDNVAGFIATISPMLLQPVPLETRVEMPVQSLAKTGLSGLFAPAFVPAPKAA